MAETFGDVVGGWQPVNEANLYSELAYGGGGWPPRRDDRSERALAEEAIQLATAEAAVRLRETGAPVASIFGLSTFHAHDSAAATAARIEELYGWYWEPWLGLFRDGVLRVPGRHPIERADLAGSFDMIGFSYYSNAGVADGRIVHHPVGAPVSPLGYGIDGDGLALVLDRLHDVLPNTPLLVAEYGVGTADDELRADYLRRGLAVVQAALARGIDVRGLFHWTAVDNYEWYHGFDVAFGIIDRDRHVRPSAGVLSYAATRT